MKCDEFKKYGEVWLDNELEAGMGAQMEHHRRECPACARYLEQLRDANEQLTLALRKPSTEQFSWDAAEIVIRQAFGRQQPDSAPERAIPVTNASPGVFLWLKFTEWRALAALWMLAAMIQLLSQITDSHTPPRMSATTAQAYTFSEFTVRNLEKTEKILANSEADDSTPVSTPAKPPSQGALPPNSRGRQV